MSTDYNSGVSIQPVELIKESFERMKSNFILLVLIVFVANLLNGFVPIILMGPMMCGIFYCLRKQFDENAVEFGDLFKGFDYFVESLIVSVLFIVSMMVLIIPLYIVFFFATMAVGNSGILMTLMLLMLTVAVIIISGAGYLVFMFPYILIIDKGMKAMDAVKLSFAAVKANLVPLIMLMLVNIGLLIVATLLCIIPVYLAMPISLGTFLLAYRKIFNEPAADAALAEPMAPEA